ncbi:hypothetical protein [Lysobacter sp. D1-1-M9]|uniref:hypothetical protein n=1 Tax=Novilysobacter longmucuonensis TaxID=3098603 RepID=UPI002FCCB5B9
MLLQHGTDHLHDEALLGLGRRVMRSSCCCSFGAARACRRRVQSVADQLRPKAPLHTASIAPHRFGKLYRGRVVLTSYFRDLIGDYV